MIYLDMDGVIVDFVKRMEELGVPYPFEDPKKLYATMAEHYRTLFKGIPPINGYEYFLNFYIANRGNVKFLSGVPEDWTDEMVEIAFEQKAGWLLRYSNAIKVEDVIVCRTSEKVNYCQTDDILIDDRKSTITNWVAKGGKGMLYFADQLDHEQRRYLARYVLGSIII